MSAFWRRVRDGLRRRFSSRQPYRETFTCLSCRSVWESRSTWRPLCVTCGSELTARLESAVADERE